MTFTCSESFKISSHDHMDICEAQPSEFCGNTHTTYQEAAAGCRDFHISQGLKVSQVLKVSQQHKYTGQNQHGRSQIHVVPSLMRLSKFSELCAHIAHNNKCEIKWIVPAHTDICTNKQSHTAPP